MRWTRNETRHAAATETPPAAAPHAVSRRLALAAGGALGALSLLGTAAREAAAAATPALGPGAAAGPGTTTVHPLAGRAAARLAGGEEAAAGTVVATVPVTGGRLLGVAFPRGTRAAGVEVRTGDGTSWGAWTTLGISDNEPDATSEESRGTVVASDPLWVGDLGPGAQVQVRLPAADAATAELHVVDPGARSADARVVRTLRSARTGEADGEAVALLAAAAAPASLATKALAQPRIASRAAWGADESLRRTAPGYSDTIKAAVVHHTAEGGTYSQAEVPAVIRGMYRYHTVTQGWSDLGYNFVVDRFGGIWEGRAGGIALPVLGAHAGGFNTDTFGVSMMGDFTSVAPSAAMLESVAQVIAWKLSLYNVAPGATAQLRSLGGGTARFKAGTTVTMPVVMAHRDVGFTACPGDVGITRMGWIRDRAYALMRGGPASAIAAKHAALGGAAGPLGRSTGPESSTPVKRGAFQHFAGGSIYWSQATGAQVVKGAIRDRWASLGWENSYLGFPVRDEGPAKGGFYSHFEGGSIYWSPATGAQVVRGAIRDKWTSLGWEGSFLGFPVTGEVSLPGGAFNHFQGGSIYWSRRTGARVVRGAIRDAWAAQGWETGRLGYPTSDEYDVPGGRRSDFQGGSLTWTASTGRVTKVLAP